MYMYCANISITTSLLHSTPYHSIDLSKYSHSVICFLLYCVVEFLLHISMFTFPNVFAFDDFINCKTGPHEPRSTLNVTVLSPKKGTKY